MPMRYLLLSALSTAILCAQTAPPVRSWSEAEKLETGLESHPDEVNTRIALLSFYSGQGMQPADRVKPLRRKHILWMVEHHPENSMLSGYLGVMEASGNPLADHEGFDACSAAWQKALAAPKPLFDVFVNAISFYKTADPERAFHIADEGLKSYPGNARLLERKGMLLAYSLAGVTAVDQYGRGASFDEARANSAAARRDRQTLEGSEEPNMLGGAASALTPLVGALRSQDLGNRAKEVEELVIRLYQRAGEFDPNGSWKGGLVSAYQNFANIAATTPEKIAALEKALAIAPAYLQGNVLLQLTRTYLDAGDTAKAADAANRLLVGADQGFSASGNGIFTANLALGRIALQNGDTKEAARRLLTAGRAANVQFGLAGPPDWILPKGLLAAGERDAVLSYLDSLHHLWTNDGGRLDNWASTIRAGGTPDFVPRNGFARSRYVGHAAPDLRLKDLKGNEQALSEYKGKVVLVDFWATWCAPCREEMPDFQKIHRELAAKDVVVLTVDVDEPLETPAAYVEKQKLTFPVLLATGTDTVKRYGVNAFPTTFAIDKNGLIADVIVGGGPNSGSRLQALIEKARAGAPPPEPGSTLPSVIPAAPAGAVPGAATSAAQPPSPSTTAEDFYRDAQRQHTAKDYAAAIRSLDRALELRPDWLPAVAARADNQYHGKQYSEAVSGFSRAIQLDPKRAGSYDARGLAYSYWGKHDQAISDYNRAIELNPDLAVAYNNRGWAYLSTGRLDEALADLNKCLDLSPTNTTALFNRAHLFERRQEYAKAIADFDSILHVDPANVQAASQKAADVRRSNGASSSQNGEDARAAGAPPIHKQGWLEVAQTFAWDLDEGVQTGGPTADLWFEAVDSRTRLIVPRNGAELLAVGDQSIGYAGCAAATLTSGKIDISTLRKGEFLCIRTNEGRIAEFRFDDLYAKSPSQPGNLTLAISFTTWERTPVSSTPPSSSALAAPRLLSPAPGVVFEHYPRETTVVWSPVAGAKAYMVEWDFRNPNGGSWASERTDRTGTVRTTDPVATFQFVGAQPGRWRVWALDAKGAAGQKSEWREFRYTR